MLAQSLQCPECGSQRIWKAGLRSTNYGEVQRYLCRDCGFRFSDPRFSRKNYINEYQQTSSRQICVSEGEMKNLVAVEKTEKKTAGEPTTIKGLLVNFEAKLILRGLKPKTILNRIRTLRLLQKRGANLLDPESVFHTITHAKKFDYSTKQLLEKGWMERKITLHNLTKVSAKSATSQYPKT